MGKRLRKREGRGHTFCTTAHVSQEAGAGEQWNALEFAVVVVVVAKVKLNNKAHVH